VKLAQACTPRLHYNAVSLCVQNSRKDKLTILLLDLPLRACTYGHDRVRPIPQRHVRRPPLQHRVRIHSHRRNTLLTTPDLVKHATMRRRSGERQLAVATRVPAAAIKTGREKIQIESLLLGGHVLVDDAELVEDVWVDVFAAVRGDVVEEDGGALPDAAFGVALREDADGTLEVVLPRSDCGLAHVAFGCGGPSVRGKLRYRD